FSYNLRQIERRQERKFVDSHLPSQNGRRHRARQREIHIDAVPHTLRVHHSNVIRSEDKIELDRRPIGNGAFCRECSVADGTLELIDLQSVAHKFQSPVSVLHTERQIWACESRVDDSDLSLQIGIRPLSIAIDVELQLSGADKARLENLSQS